MTNVATTPDTTEAGPAADQEQPPSLQELQARQKAQQGWLRGQAAPLKRRVMLAVLLGFLAGLCVIGQAALLATVLYDVVVQGQPLDGFWPHIAGLAGLMILRASLMGLAERVGMATATKLKAGLRQDMLERVAAAGPDFVADTGSGKIITNLYDQIEALDNYIARYLPQRMLAGLVPLAIVVAVWPVNWLAALILLFTGPAIVMMMALVGLGAATASRRQMIALERLGGYFVDRLRGLGTLRLFGQADAELERVGAMAERFRSGTMSVLRLAFLSSAVLEFFSSIAIAILAVNIGLALLGLFNPGPLADITLYAGLFILILAPDFYMPLRLLGQYYHDRATAMAAADGLMGLETAMADYAAANATAAKAAPSQISFSKVVLEYPDGRRALDQVDLDITSGERIALIGASGGGKSSIFKLLLGFTAPTGGQITIDGVPLDQAGLRDHCAWVGQRTHLFRGTIAENIALGRPDATEGAIIQAANAAGVSDFARSLPYGLDTQLGDNNTGVSGGEAQRIAIARAYLANRPILLMDEPTAHLDRATATRILDSLEPLMAGRTVILATHSPQVLSTVDRVICLDHGRVVTSEDAAQLLDEAVA
ncbi:MAG: thiol reductant ABC exporter subunit CydD [Alphaproteobacteria bacterium]|nr:thiol reductant ABC exporter subunit CydD [Alphaproteobacteria bacterium SS10]